MPRNISYDFKKTLSRIDKLARIHRGDDEIIEKLTNYRLALQFHNNPKQAPCAPIEIPSSASIAFKRKCKKMCGDYFLITERDLRDEGENGLNINKSGKYRLAENIVFRPTQPNVQAITITASNVVLDLSVFTLSQDLGDNVQSGIIGIAIARDVNNVVITGKAGVAKILDFNLAGIRLLGRTQQITIENVTITQTAARVLHELVPAPQSCEDVQCMAIQFGIAIGEGDIEGLIYAGTDKNNIVRNLIIDNVTCLKTMFACKMVMTFEFRVTNCSFNENTSAGLFIGPRFPIASDLPNTLLYPVVSDGYIANCHFDRNFRDAPGYVVPSTISPFNGLNAIELSACTNIILEDCTTNNNTNRQILLAVDHDGASNIIWRRHTSSGNRSLASNCDGFHLSGSFALSFGCCSGLTGQTLQQDVNILLEKVVSTNNGAGRSNGFNLVYVVNARIEDCDSTGNFSTDSTDPVGANGFSIVGEFPGGTIDQLTFLRCTAQGNGSKDVGILGSGFRVRSSVSNLIFKSCIANGNGINSVNATASGFRIDPNFFGQTPNKNILFEKCIAIGNGLEGQNPERNGGFLFVTDIVYPPNIFPYHNITVQNCKSNFNINGLKAFTTSGTQIIELVGLVVMNSTFNQNFNYGIDIASVQSQKLIAGNIAYNNGLANYNGVPPGTIINTSSDVLVDSYGLKNVSICSPPVPINQTIFTCPTNVKDIPLNTIAQFTGIVHVDLVPPLSTIGTALVINNDSLNPIIRYITANVVGESDIINYRIIGQAPCNLPSDGLINIIISRNPPVANSPTVEIPAGALFPILASEISTFEAIPVTVTITSGPTSGTILLNLNPGPDPEINLSACNIGQQVQFSFTITDVCGRVSNEGTVTVNIVG